jgi:DNA-directed RNA polymerase specialized sigma24 family protein
VLRYYSDLSEAQIAQILEISPGAVKTHAHRGLTALRKTIDPRELS